MEMIVGIEKCDDTKILIETDGKLPDDVTLKNVVSYYKMMMNFVHSYS